LVTIEQSVEAKNLYDELKSQESVANKLGISRHQVKKRLDFYYSNPESIVYRNAIENGIDYNSVKFSWIKNEEVSMFWKREDDPSFTYFDKRHEIIEEMKKHAPTYPKIQRSIKTGNYCLIIDPADIHVNKLALAKETGKDYNINIAVDTVYEAVKNLVRTASNSYEIDEIIFVIGNDVLHTDDHRGNTTSGTPQDYEAPWWLAYQFAKQLYIKCIELFLPIAPVYIVYCPSNHDWKVGQYLADSLYSWFHNQPDVRFGFDQNNISMLHRKYVVYGNNLIGFTHGDGAKLQDLSNIMQYEAREEWGKTKFAYFYTHHLHHKMTHINNQMVEKDYVGVTVLRSNSMSEPNNSVYIETIRSPSSPDGWHHRNGYINNTAIEAFVHHTEKGQVARFVEYT
jgi:hypothetical protein